MVPEIFHESLAAGTVLPADPAGTEKGTQLKKSTKVTTYARDLEELIKFLKANPQCSGRIGAVGFCMCMSIFISLLVVIKVTYVNITNT